MRKIRFSLDIGAKCNGAIQAAHVVEGMIGDLIYLVGNVHTTGDFLAHVEHRNTKSLE